MKKLLLLLLLASCSDKALPPLDKNNLLVEMREAKRGIAAAKGQNTRALSDRLKEARDLYAEAMAKSKLTKDFKDPDSVKYKDVRIIDKGLKRVVCGLLNAKNSYGAYVGYTRFYYYVDFEETPVYGFGYTEEKDDTSSFTVWYDAACG